MKPLHWVSCDGGPHLFVDRELSVHWLGIRPPEDGRIVQASFRWNEDPGSPASDYDAACSVDGLVGLVPVGAGEGLVLGDEVPMSTWIKREGFEGGVLVVPMCWPKADSDGRLVRAVRGVPTEEFVETGIRITSHSGVFVLFPACDSTPDRVYPVCEVQVPPGTYSIRTAAVRQSGFDLRIHGLARSV